jgi:hypothetical protein
MIGKLYWWIIRSHCKWFGHNYRPAETTRVGRGIYETAVTCSWCNERRVMNTYKGRVKVTTDAR